MGREDLAVPLGPAVVLALLPRRFQGPEVGLVVLDRPLSALWRWSQLPWD